MKSLILTLLIAWQLLIAINGTTDVPFESNLNKNKEDTFQNLPVSSSTHTFSHLSSPF
jgi:hypothetical protein